MRITTKITYCISSAVHSVEGVISNNLHSTNKKCQWLSVCVCLNGGDGMQTRLRKMVYASKAGCVCVARGSVSVGTWRVCGHPRVGVSATGSTRRRK